MAAMEQSCDHESIDSTAIARQLVEAVAACLPGWMRRLVDDRCTSAGRPLSDVERTVLDERLSAAAATTIARLTELLATDVDQQRTNPLAVLRASVAEPTAVLADLGVPPVRRSEFDERVLPDDRYALAPATWTDIDESLHEPGLIWGAWKAATILQRRRTEGRLT
jgi:hypothetical protein